VVIIRSSL